MSKLLLFALLSFFLPLFGSDVIYLRDNLKRAQPGDYIVTAQSKTYTLLHIYDKSDSTLTIEEISIPTNRVDPNCFSWKGWVQQDAPGNTAWVMYTLNLDNASIKEYFSFTKNAWFEMPPADNFLSVLLNLKLNKIPRSQMKKVGPSLMHGPDMRRAWQPKIIANGQPVQGVVFAAWKTQWPQDGSELAGKNIEVYVPEENEQYPSYFPYWLQISGAIGKAKVRIIDSGAGLVSPRAKPQVINKN